MVQIASAIPSIRVWDRKNQREIVEEIYGDRFVRLLYENRLGRLTADHLLSKPSISKIYGLLQSLPPSALKIPEFIRKFRVPMDEFEPGPYFSFNRFFIRKFRPGARVFEKNPGRMPAFAEGRYYAFEKLDVDTKFPIKGKLLDTPALLGDVETAKDFLGGPALVARLCPVDYHRFHFPDDGRVVRSYRIHGSLHSVNPVAIASKPDVLFTNERQITLLETNHFGKLAYVEIGAICVGRIVQTYDPGCVFRRGEEKGYFLFGGSSVVLLGEPGKWKPDPDILGRTSHGVESLLRLGEGICSSEAT